MTRAAAQQDVVEVWIGESATRVGTLVYARQGAREYSSFHYEPDWLAHAERFQISPDLPLISDRTYHNAPSKEDSVFPFAVADTEPDGWGRRIIARARAKQRSAKRAESDQSTTPALSELDYLLGVDDVSRVGALRFKRSDSFERAPQPGERGTPPLLGIRQIIEASHALERGTETAQDLRYLRGRGTSLGGMRPKCSLVDEDGSLAIGKFPSIADERAVTKGEVLALRLAARAGVNAASARTVYSGDLPVTVVRRFDREQGNRVPYVSAATMLQASRNEDRSYTEIADQILRFAAEADRDLHELWRRIVFNLLITNVDDHLANHGFLHVEHGLWRLAPAFDLNPFPDKERELKTWLSADTGPSASLSDALDLAPYFHLDLTTARGILRQVNNAVASWHDLARTPEVDMSNAEAKAFVPAFEHEGRREAERLVKKKK